MARNGSRPGEGAAHSVANHPKNATEPNTAAIPATKASPPATPIHATPPLTRFVVVLQGTAGVDYAHAHTLRYLLKKLLRSHSLRCIEVRQLDCIGGEQ